MIRYNFTEVHRSIFKLLKYLFTLMPIEILFMLALRNYSNKIFAINDYPTSNTIVTKLKYGFIVF